jgi:hypothetical protein
MTAVYREVEVDIGEFDDDDLIDELEHRGYTVLMEDQEDQHPEILEMIWRFKHGYIEDAMILLERRFPEMYGISKLIKEK